MTIEATVGSKILRLNSQGDDVKAVQLAMRSLGYALTGTGYFGNATDVAVTAFQARAGLVADGDVGNTTAKALDVALGGKVMNADLPVVPHLEISRPLWLEAGVKLLGTREGAGSKDNVIIIDWAHEEGGSIASSYTHDSIPWCALFANHILTKVNLKGTETLWALDFADPKKWPCVKLPGPAVGAFAPMLRDGGGHITIVAGKDQNGRIMGLGGNQSDAVTIAPFAVSRLNKGFFWPAGVPLPTQFGLAHLPLITSSGKVSSNEA